MDARFTQQQWNKLLYIVHCDDALIQRCILNAVVEVLFLAAL
jgi:hypothetical protein